MTTTETSLRVRFAKAMGYVYVAPVPGINTTAHRLVWENGMPDPSDSNTIREALMGMTEEEWHKFLVELFAELDIYGKRGFVIGKAILQTPPTTLAELICEVKGVK